MKNIGIKYQLRLTTLIPVLVVALLFALFYNGQFSRDLNRHTSRLGEAYIRQLIPAAQLALLRDDKRILQGLIDASTINQEIQSLAFYNAKGQLLAYRGGKHSLKKAFIPPEFTGDYIESKQINPYSIHFIAPITVPKFNLYSFTPFKPPASPIKFQADDILGWLSIDIDTQSTLIKKYQMYIVTIFITLLGLLLGLSIHYLLSKQIYLPIARLRRSMKQILRNEFETMIKTSSKGELGIIEKGCAHLQTNYLNMVDELNQHVETATADLQKNLELLEEKNIELTLEKKKMDEKIRHKSEFIANMSHEIRTPMNGVIGFTNILLESKLDPLQEDYVKTIRASAQDLLSIINDILDYSKIDAGKLHLDCIPLDIRGCIDDVLSLLAPSAHKKGLDLIPSTATNVPATVLGDPLRLKQIMSNLITNAIKFTEQGYVHVSAKIVKENEQSYTICLAVTDTGIGISTSEQSTLFNAFHQADTSITRRFGGSGLGLVISKKLAEHMNGRITLTSDQHKGSTFSAYIQLTKLAAYEIEKNQTHRFSRLKVICFDDNPLYLEAVCNGLGFWGIECIQVASLKQLESAFKNHRECELAFVNVNKGCEQQIAHILRHKTMPCILLSKWLVSDYENMGAQGFLFKPPNIQKLHDTIDAVLNPISCAKPDDNVQPIEQLRESFHRAGLSILIAEDNDINRRLLHSLLAEYAHIVTVKDGADAVTACENTSFNAILLDLQMPKLNGLEAAEQIRQQSLLNKQTPIILISANHIDKPYETLKKHGIDLCLPKPVNETKLISYLLEHTKKTKTHIINWSLCLRRVSGNQALALEFLARFTEELLTVKREFIQLKQHKNIQGLARAAHKLHGACCFCGVPDLQFYVAEFEKQANNATHIQTLERAFSQLIKSIDIVINEYEANWKSSSIVEPS